MFISTPERSASSLSMDRLQKPAANSGQFLLPPLSAILNDEVVSPPRPSLPALSSFATPQTPRYILPSIRSASTPAVATLTGVSTTSPPFVAATPRVFESLSPNHDSRPGLNIISGGTSTPSTNATSTSHASNISGSMDLDADISINDSMVRPAAKRKHSATLPSRDFAFISHSPATYPSQEPSIDNALLARRKRRRTSPVELAVLNEEFSLGLTPDKPRRMEIASKVNMTEKAVQIWFQNKRQSLRRLKNSEKEVTELPPTPEPLFYASTPLRPTLVKAESQNFGVSPDIVMHSPLRSYSAPDLHKSTTCLNKGAGVKVSLLSKMLATSKDEKKELVMNLTQKKQPGFARQSAQASTQVMTFKLTPKERRPLATINTNTTTGKANAAKDSQCVQSLLSLKVGHH